MHRLMNKPDTPKDARTASTQATLKRGQSAQVQRDLRSKAALKANMARRKAQISGKAQIQGAQIPGAQIQVAQTSGKETEAADQGSPEDE